MPNFGYTAPATAGPAFGTVPAIGGPGGQPFAPAPTPQPAPQPTPQAAPQPTPQPTQPAGQLDEASRSKLDGIVQEMQKNGETDDYIQNVVDDFKQKYGGPPPPPAKVPGLFGMGQINQSDANLGQDIVGGIGNVLQQYGQSVANQWNAGQAQIDQPFIQQGQAGGGGVGQVKALEGAAAIGSGLGQKLSAPLAPIGALLSAGVHKVGDALSNTPTIAGYGKDMTLPGVDQAQTPAPERILNDISNTAGAAQTVLPGIGEVKPALSELGSSLSKFDARMGGTSAPAEAPDNAIVSAYTKAVKPTISAKTTVAQTDAYNAKVVDAVNTIAQNKDALKFTTEDGSIEQGRLPKSLSEFAQAIDQTKKNIYAQYDALATQAGEKGAVVKPEAVTKDLETIVNDKALQFSHPDAVTYAKSIIDRYSKSGDIDAPTAQKIIENYNAELQSFYRNPSYNQASRVAIDAALVRNLRSSLDDVITHSTGSQYQTLRNQYGSLKTVEGDVNKAANRRARLNDKGLADYTDIFSGGDIVHGILSLNLALFAKGIAQHGFKSYFKFMNNPDRGVTTMFNRSGNYLESKNASAASKATLPTNTPTATDNATPMKNIPDTVPQKGLLDKAKQVYNTVKTEGNKGFVRVPGGKEPLLSKPKSAPSSKPTTPNTTPEDVAGTMNDASHKLITDYLQKPSDLNAHLAVQPLIRKFGISDLSPAHQDQFLKEAAGKYAQDSTVTFKAKDLYKKK